MNRTKYDAKIKEMVAISKICDRRNKFFKIENWTDQEIDDKRSFYDKSPVYFTIVR